MLHLSCCGAAGTAFLIPRCTTEVPRCIWQQPLLLFVPGAAAGSSDPLHPSPQGLLLHFTPYKKMSADVSFQAAKSWEAVTVPALTQQRGDSGAEQDRPFPAPPYAPARCFCCSRPCPQHASCNTALLHSSDSSSAGAVG